MFVHVYVLFANVVFAGQLGALSLTFLPCTVIRQLLATETSMFTCKHMQSQING